MAEAGQFFDGGTTSGAIKLAEPGPTGYVIWGKRALDVALVLLTALLWLPLYLAAALMLLIIDGRPIHHTASRVGAGGREFLVVKFRTMRPHSTSDLAGILAADPGLDREFRETFKLRKDPRVTPFGSVLRRLSLDELPQLLNVLKGDMSLVGPRPVLRTELEEYYGDKADLVLNVKPGMTGLWQISGRSLLPYEERVRLDCRYVTQCGLLTDLRIVLRTIPSVFKGVGAF